MKVTHSAICGSDLWFYREPGYRDLGSTVGHVRRGVVAAGGDAGRAVYPGDRVLAPFVVSCGACEYCRTGLQTSCIDGRSWGGENGGAQGEFVRVLHANGGLVRVLAGYRMMDEREAIEVMVKL